MLTRLTRTIRLRAAITLVLAYALCVLAPPVALAFMNGAAVVHCLTARHAHRTAAVKTHDVDAHAQHTAAHDHGGAFAHQHDSHHGSAAAQADGQAAGTNCCGIFCLSAMPMSPAPDVSPPARILSLVSAVGLGIAGRGPDRIDRPPIALLPH
jgi:hypothetical protein